jgi:hypothetical protein
MKQLIRHPSLNWILVAVSFYCFLMLYTIPSEAKVVGKAEPVPGKDHITLHSEQGPICPPSSFRAVYYVSQTKESIEGCYVVKDGMVHLGFMDGDRGSLPLDQFTWVPGSAPSMGNEQPGVGPGKDTNGTPKRRTPIIATRGGAKEAGNWM